MKVNDAQFQSTNPILPVKNVKETALFYKENLGFNIDVVWENPNYACVSRSGVTLEFGEGRPEHVGSGICYIHVKDVEKVYQLYNNLGLNLVGDLEARDYGSKDFRIRDNNGNLLIIGSSLSNKKELVAERNIA